MITIEFWNKKTYEVAEHLGELSQSNFIEAIKLTSNSDLEIDFVKAELLQLLIPISVKELDLNNESTLSGFLQLMELTDPFFVEDFETGKWNRKLCFSEFPITTVKCNRWNEMRCPGDLLSKLSFGHYKNVVSTIKMIQLSPEDLNLFRLLMACLFVDSNNPDEWAKEFMEVDDWTLYSVYWIVAANLEYLSKNEVYIDGEPIDFGPLFSSEGTKNDSQKNNFGLNRVLFQLAESSVFSSIKDVENTPFLQVMLRLLDLNTRTHDTEKV